MIVRILYDATRSYARAYVRAASRAATPVPPRPYRPQALRPGDGRGPAITRPRTAEEKQIVAARVEAVYQAHLKRKRR